MLRSMDIHRQRTLSLLIWLPVLVVLTQTLVVCSLECKDQCSEVGTQNATCDNTTGVWNCTCKPFYSGPLCSECKDGYFNTSSCQPCECDKNGAVNQTCDGHGNCFCKANVNGSKCDSCNDGYFNLTAGCVICECNGHSDTCDAVTGVCSDCKNHTTGVHCDSCELYYYRDDTQGLEDGCQLCPCDDKTSTQTCHYDADYDNNTGSVVCDSCKDGYSQPLCEDCADNYFMDNSTCQLCDCNGNINLEDTGNCDPLTGKCLKCLYNTTGRHCEECLPDYHGDPIIAKNCTYSPNKPDEPTRASTSTNIITITVIALIVVIVVIAGIGLYCYRQRHYRKAPLPFWTIELRKDDSMSFNDYHNLDSSLIDDVLVAPRGQLRMGDTSNYETINS
ncbi:multiple epidermal growth factor-like domains protein 9 [Ptychodera flava]|uniref:multiple epidermal growth factor-like domains protein 9 n=1 Tax=Ptychodera flava TaxID=63121 RepID=UPI00396A2EB5